MPVDKLAVLRALVERLHDLEIRRADTMRLLLKEILEAVPILIPLDEDDHG